jgi:hypothetical protein
MVTKFLNIFQRRDLKNFYGLSFFSNFYIFFFSKSIFIFHFWTKINVQKSIFQNNVGFSTNVDIYIINGQNNLKNFYPNLPSILFNNSSSYTKFPDGLYDLIGVYSFLDGLPF